MKVLSPSVGGVRVGCGRPPARRHRLCSGVVAGGQRRVGRTLGVLDRELDAAVEIAIAVEKALDLVGELAGAGRTSGAVGGGRARDELVELRWDVGVGTALRRTVR